MNKLTEPTEPVLYFFYPTKDFYEKSVGTQYVSGQRYSVREGNSKLDKLVKKWKKEGKVKS